MENLWISNTNTQDRMQALRQINANDTRIKKLAETVNNHNQKIKTLNKFVLCTDFNKELVRLNENQLLLNKNTRTLEEKSKKLSKNLKEFNEKHTLRWDKVSQDLIKSNAALRTANRRIVGYEEKIEKILKDQRSCLDIMSEQKDQILELKLKLDILDRKNLELVAKSTNVSIKGSEGQQPSTSTSRPKLTCRSRSNSNDTNYELLEIKSTLNLIVNQIIESKYQTDDQIKALSSRIYDIQKVQGIQPSKFGFSSGREAYLSQVHESMPKATEPLMPGSTEDYEKNIQNCFVAGKMIAMRQKSRDEKPNEIFDHDPWAKMDNQHTEVRTLSKPPTNLRYFDPWAASDKPTYAFAVSKKPSDVEKLKLVYNENPDDAQWADTKFYDIDQSYDCILRKQLQFS